MGMPHYWKRKGSSPEKEFLTSGSAFARVGNMEKQNRKFHKAAPEMKSWVEKYGCSLGESPQFILFGQYNSKQIGPVMGILAASNNEFHAHLLRREFEKNGHVEVKRTEFHPDPNFSIQDYREKVRARMEQQKKKEAE